MARRQVTSPEADSRRLLVVTATYPWGQREAFIEPELRQLCRSFAVAIVPVWPRGGQPSDARADEVRRSWAASPWSLGVLSATVLEAMRRPSGVLRSVRLVLGGGWLATARNLAAVPKGLWTGRVARAWGADHIHAYWASVPATAAMVASEVTGIPWSMTAHRGDVEGQSLLSVKVRRAQWTRPVSERTVELIAQALGEPVSQRLVPVVHLGIDIPAPREALHAKPAGPLRILCPARLIPLKRHGDLLRAVKLLVDRKVQVTLDLAGDGPEKERIRSLVSGLGLEERVTLLGHLEHDDLLRRYRTGEVDLVVLASEVEGIPVGLMEAMAAGVPVVATDAGGVRELLDGRTGTIVPIGDVEALAAAIEEVTRRPADQREQVADAARRRVVEEFDARTTAMRLARLVLHG